LPAEVARASAADIRGKAKVSSMKRSIPADSNWTCETAPARAYGEMHGYVLDRAA
jgi:hypothetical protein